MALYRESKDKDYQEKAVAELTSGLEFWEQYTASSAEQTINPLWTNRVGYVDWENLKQWAADDILIAKEEAGK